MPAARLRAVLTTVVLTSTVAIAPTSVSAAPTPSTEAGRQAAVTDPARMLGDDWKSSSDVLVTGSGDTDGFHLYIAREKDAFAWSRLATLTGGRTEGGAWTGYVCLTGSGRYAAVVYAPVMTTNKPALVSAGALAAVVDVSTGTARQVANDVQLAYYNPGCGPDDRILLTRAIGSEQQQTDLLTVDAVAGKVATTRRVKAQLTNPAPGPDGDYGVIRGEVVRVAKNGQPTVVARPGGQPYGLRATADAALDLVTLKSEGGVERSAAYRHRAGGLTHLGTSPGKELELFGLADGRNALVGDVTGIATGAARDLRLLKSSRPAQGVSRQGHLVVQGVSVEQTRERMEGRKAAAGVLQVTVESPISGERRSGTVRSERRAPADVARPTFTGPTAAALDDPLPPPPPITDPGDPKCVIPRNELTTQVLQPSANQVEWAVDQAANGVLLNDVSFPGVGQPYKPQVLFKKPTNAPNVPAQLMLAILAQETNLAQASWHAVPGDAGNPLVSDYYGHRAYEGDIRVIDYGEADCGYGISQVTDGMARGQNTYGYYEQQAIAMDYQANIAAGMQILQAKWLEVVRTGSMVNNGNPAFIENWYLAVWGYNSGVYQNTGGPYGVGWYNNPANPQYKANRPPFLRTNKNDASHPADWSYPEKIMGWAEVPQWQWIAPETKYLTPAFGTGSNDQLQLPGLYQFCGTVNYCTPNVRNACPSDNSNCWWHGTTSWSDGCAAKCAKERLAFPLFSSEPPLLRVYPTACKPFKADIGTVAAVIDDTNWDSGMNRLGCASQPRGGKFTLRTGSPFGSNAALYGQVDLHQIGGGYLGHNWFTHSYDGDAGGSEEFKRHRVVGTWTTDLPSDDYEIVVHLPSHGANEQVDYIISAGDGGAGGTDHQIICPINQNSANWEDTWVSLGWTWLYPGAKVQLDNIIAGGDGTVDVAYDAIAFVNVPGYANGRSCGDPYPGN